MQDRSEALRDLIATRLMPGGETPLADALRLARTIRSPVQAVSRVWFDLSDTDAFDQCVAQSVNWMAERPKGSGQPRSGVPLPDEAWKAEAFDVTDELGANPSKAVRLVASDGVLWAARLDWPDPTCPRSWVSEFFVEKRHGQMARFGAQLTCVRRGECPPFDITRPTVIQRVLENLSAEADGRPLADQVEPLDRSEIGELVELLYREDRRLPVVVITEGEDGQTGVPLDVLSRRIAGSAHIVHLGPEAAWELTHRVGKRMSAFNGAVRLYQPGLREIDEDPFGHPLWLRGAQPQDALVRNLAGRVLPAAFLDRADRVFPRYAAVRDAVSRQALRSRSEIRVSAPDRELELAYSQAAELTEERDEWHSLALEEQDRRLDAEKEVERLKSEVARLEAKGKVLEYSAGHRENFHSEASAPRALASYDDLEDWADEVLGDAVYLHQAALKDCRKNGHESMLPRIEAALLIMRDHMSPARATNDASHREIAKQKLAELGMDDTACFSDRDEARRRPQYSVRYEGDTRVLFDHLKYGNGYNNANQIRIYYLWDDERKRHVVGKMPSHLPNNLTN